MKAYVMIAVIALAMLLSGCQTGNDSVGNNWKTFIGGTEGVQAHFDIDTPPDELNIGDEFNTVVVLENMGEHTVPANEYFVRIMGVSPEAFGTTASALIVRGSDVGEDLQANEMNPDTGETIESYPVYLTIPQSGMMRYSEGIAGNMDFTFQAEICYQYQTVANGKLCVKRDLTKSSDTNVCTISGPQMITSSGAPVQITNLREFSGGREAVRFGFTVVAANTGGKISAPGSDCSIARTDENKIHVTISTGLSGLRCNGLLDQTNERDGTVSGVVALSSGSRQIMCTQNLEGHHESDYVKIIEITADYDYDQTIQKKVLMKRVE